MPNHRDLSSPVPWRRSLRAAQHRRLKLALRRRRIVRGRAGVLVAVALSSVAAGGALAQDSTPSSSTPAASSSDTLRAVQQKLGVAADGVNGPRTRAAVGPRPPPHRPDDQSGGGPPTHPPRGQNPRKAPSGAASSSSSGDASATLQKIAQCESGGDPAAVSADGTYRGKYQFDRATWRQMGGTGDPAAAPEAEQDRIAAELLAQRGTAPWPVCGDS